MRRKPRVEPSSTTSLTSDDVLHRIKFSRPLRLFIRKERKKNSNEKESPLVFRARFNQLPSLKQSRFLQKAVDRYLQILDENDIDQKVQVDCCLFDRLLSKGEQRKYFQSIGAPSKPEKKVRFASTNDDEKTSKNTAKQRERDEVNAIYLNQVKSFSRDLPDRLKIDYLRFAVSKTRLKEKVFYDQSVPEADRKRRRSLSILPSSLQVERKAKKKVASDEKLTEEQLKFLHECEPSFLYYEENVPQSQRLEFKNANAKNGHIRSLFNQLDDKCRLSYICRSVEKWMKYLESKPIIVEKCIPTLHLLLRKNDDIIAYFMSLGLPARPPRNTLVYFQRICQKEKSNRSWSDLTQSEKNDYGKKFTKLKADYLRQLRFFLENVILNEYMKCEFFRNAEYAMKDYEIAVKERHLDVKLEPSSARFEQFLAMKTDVSRFEKVKTKLLGTPLSDEQKQLVEQMTDIVRTLTENLV